jgi:hypothetical protein
MTLEVLDSSTGETSGSATRLRYAARSLEYLRHVAEFFHLDCGNRQIRGLGKQIPNNSSETHSKSRDAGNNDRGNRGNETGNTNRKNRGMKSIRQKKRTNCPKWQVRIRLNGTPDEDITFLSHAKVYVPSGTSGFSTLAQQCVAKFGGAVVEVSTTHDRI